MSPEKLFKGLLLKVAILAKQRSKKSEQFKIPKKTITLEQSTVPTCFYFKQKTEQTPHTKKRKSSKEQIERLKKTK